jgi:N-methylhydantoinase A
VKLDSFLKEKGWSPSYFARLAKTNPSTIHRIVLGKVKPSPATMARIVAATGGAVKPNDFYDLASAPESESQTSTGRSVSLGVDIGGTFTDLIFFDAHMGGFSVGKVRTTPGDLSRGVFQGLDQLGIDCATLKTIAHGTTIGLNAFLERKGAPTGLITTRGFRDIYEIARHNRINTYDLFYQKPAPLVRRRHRLEVRERIDADGTILEPIDEASVVECANHFRAVGIRSIAVCLLHSYINPAHEEQVAAIIARVYPAARVTTSSSIVRQWREYERTSTTVMNAYVMPVVGQYLDRLEEDLAARGYTSPLFVSQSAGGLISIRKARDKPVSTIMSGPSGGVVAARYTAATLNRKNVITFDMGGTSTDVALIHNGRIKVAGEGALDRHPLLIPMIDLKSIGAGGGSIARVSPNGALGVGPESAGAVPGPVCYGQGGVEPTVTDANVILGRLPAEHFLGGAMVLDSGRAYAAMEKSVGRPLRLDVNKAALGVIEVINIKMAYAVRAITIERGLDPKQFALLPFGGAGPMHACAIARHLGIPEIIVPVAPGAYSAFGMLVSNVRHDFVRTALVQLAHGGSSDMIAAHFDAMIAEAQETLASEGIAAQDMLFERALDIRYVGQEYTVSVPVASSTLNSAAMADVSQRFHRLHEQQYGHSSPSEPVEIVDLRLSAESSAPPTSQSRMPRGESTPDDGALIGKTRTIFGSSGTSLETPLIDRKSLRAGNRFDGPAIIVEQTATTIVEPGFQALILDTGEIILSQRG